MNRLHQLAAFFVWLTLTVGLAVAPSLYSSASAQTGDSTGTMTYAEWTNIVEGQLQSDVQGDCGCTGYIYKSWLGDDGHKRKWVDYAEAAIIQYRLTGTGWRTDYRKWWCVSGTCYPTEY